MNPPLNSFEDVSAEAHRLWLRHSSPLGRLSHFASRLFIRSFRICAGFGVGGAAYYLGASCYDLSHKAISSLSVADLLSIVVCAFGAASFLALAAIIAFGPYQPPSSPQDFAAQAAAAVTLRNHQKYDEQKRRDRIGKRYAKSKVWGVLLDPDFGQKTKTQIFLARLGMVIAIYGILGLIIWLSNR